MKPHTINIANATTLITIGLWSYFGSETPSVTALIPVIFGTVLISLTKGLKNEKKIPAHLVVIFTVLVLLGLLKPFASSIGKANYWALFRVSIMILTSIIALVSFIKSFIDARKSN